jgi:[ribulose-bisphosphate carboxylase]-lysine N-methyltransferase
MQEIESSVDDDLSSPAQLCSTVRASETKALSRTLEYVNREKEALDLKEYYQERRLKDLNLNSDWNPDEGPARGDVYDEDDISFGQARAPGSSLDW